MSDQPGEPAASAAPSPRDLRTGAHSGPPDDPNRRGDPLGRSGWYSGPVPFTGLVARESIGQAVARTVAKTLAAIVTLGVGVIGLIALVAVGLAAVTGSAASSDPLPTDFVAGDEGNPNVLLAIAVTGVILGEKQGTSLFSDLGLATYGYQVKADLEQAARRSDIKAVILEMDTPGGTIFGAKAIADAVQTYQRRTGRPVVAYVRGISASGGVYAMAGADHIIADHGTLVGSIGVIFGPLSRYTNVVGLDGGLLMGGVQTTGGIVEEYITAGRSKDLGNPFRDLTTEERAVLQQGVDYNYDAFVEHVAAGRAIDAGTIRSQLGALIFDEGTALHHGLLDEVGNRDQAYAQAAELAKLKPGNWQVARVDQGGSGLFGLGVVLNWLGLRTEGGGTNGGPTDPRTMLCERGPTMLAYYGALPRTCS